MALSPMMSKEDNEHNQEGKEKLELMEEDDKDRGREKNRTQSGRSSSSSSSSSSSESSSGSSSGTGSSASSLSGSLSSRSSSSSSSSPSPSRHSRSESSSAKRGGRQRSPTSKPSTEYVGGLTRNVIKKHIQEMFSTYGKIKMIDIPVNHLHPHLSKGYAYVEFETPEEAEMALKHMHEGHVEGAQVTVTPTVHFPPEALAPFRRMRAVSPWRLTSAETRSRSRSPLRGRCPSPERHRRDRSRSSSNSSR